LLAAIADFVEIPGANECCGAAGSGVVRPADAGKAIVDPKVRAILHANIDYLVTADSRCTRQMRVALRRAGSRVRVLNLAELLLIASKFEEPIQLPDLQAASPRTDDLVTGRERPRNLNE